MSDPKPPIEAYQIELALTLRELYAIRVERDAFKVERDALRDRLGRVEAALLDNYGWTNRRTLAQRYILKVAAAGNIIREGNDE